MPDVVRRPSQASAPCRAEYFYRDGGHELRIDVRGVDPDQVAAVSEGEAEFALVVEEPVIVLCARFGDAVPWTAATYVSQGTRREPGSIPSASNSPHESRALLHVALVEATTGQTLAERNLTLWLDFSRVLVEAVRDQSRTAYDPLEHHRTMARLRRRHPTDASLAATASVRCFGSL